MILIVAAGCGDGDTQASFQTRVTAATGGTVTAGGATLVIPPGALSQDTTITVTITSPGSSLPESSTVKGDLYDFGPNGTTFSTPATLTLPMTRTPTANERAIISFLDPVADQWVNLPSTVMGSVVSAPVLHFTEHAPRILPVTPDGPPARYWEYSKYLADKKEKVPAEDPSIFHLQTSGIEVDDFYDYGPTFLIIDGQSRAKGKVFSSANGKTYWVEAQSPAGSIEDKTSTIGTYVELLQTQSFHKKPGVASLKLKVTGIALRMINNNSIDELSRDCHGKPPEECPVTMEAEVGLRITVFQGKKTLFSRETSVIMTRAENGVADYAFDWTHGYKPLWSLGFFSDNFRGKGAVTDAALTLTQHVPIEVDLSEVDDKVSFGLHITAHARTYNLAQRESYVSAYFRDPVDITGTTIETVGLDLTDDPVPLPPDDREDAPPCTSGSNPAAGTLEFSASSFTVPELPVPGPHRVTVTRTGGTSGVVSATVTTSDGTAIAGADYTAVNTTVLFGDGVGGSRTVEVPLILNSNAEPDKTVNLTLSDPRGCATLGPQSSTVLTIQDDDQPPPVTPTHTVGGTVTGLVGTGLVLTIAGLNLSPGNGPFTFPQPLPVGVAYNVTVDTQPTNPNQVCTVTKGSGTIGDADVTNVAVDCVTLPTNGALDPSFGSGGKVTGPGGASGMALQASDGKIVVVGGRSLSRYNTDGSLDTSFGAGGVVPGVVPVVFTGALDDARAVAIQPDSMIVVAGVTRGAGTNDFGDFAVARYDASGNLDTNFGTGGKVTTDFHAGSDEASAVRIQTDGRIVVAGSAAASSSFPVDNDFAVARYTSAGILDTGFGTGGKVSTNVAGRTDLVNAAVLSSDGKIVLAGRVADGSATEPDLCLVRYKTDGSLDMGFGNNGIVRTDLGLGNWEEATDLVMQPDGKIVVGALVVVGGKFSFGVARFDGAGALDGTFGIAGVATAAFPAQDDYANAVALQPDGKIVVAGRSPQFTTSDFAIARFDVTGMLDGSFGTGGKVTVDFFGGSDGAESVVVQSDGKIVMAGFAQNGASNGLALARVNP